MIVYFGDCRLFSVMIIAIFEVWSLMSIIALFIALKYPSEEAIVQYA